MEDLQSLLAIERFAEDAFRVKKTYVDMTGDLLSGILLGQIVYWHLPSKDGRSKLRVQKEGKLWLAKGRADWYDEIRITPKQFDRAIKILVDKDFIETKLFKFDGSPTVHIHLHPEHVIDSVFPQRSKSILPKGENPFYPKVEIHFDERLKTLTETTTKTTSETTTDKPIVEQASTTHLDIIDYLNLKTGKKYKASTRTTRTLINARLNDKFTLDDFKMVIDNKVRDWSNDPKMSKFIRPETLFGTKFESYLNETHVERKFSTPDHSAYDPTFGKDLPF